MKCRNIDDITIPKKAWRRKRKYTTKLPYVGLDTETENGKCFVIGASSQGTTHIKRTNDFYDFVQLCVGLKLNETVNFFYNLTYDYQALIKLLEPSVIMELAVMEEVQLNDNIHLKLIPSKLFQVTIAGKKYRFYDLAQFYNHQPLKKAAQVLGGEGKLDQDVTRLSADRYDKDRQYREELDRYLIRDCELCHDLAEHLYTTVKDYMTPQYFYSQASFSQQYFLENMPRDYRLPPRKVLDYALKAYNGGRFEVMKRGTFTGVSAWDIRSAYPYQNVQVPAMDKGSWVETDEYDPKALISLFRITATGKSVISPMKAETKEGLILYPVGRRKDMYVNKAEYETLIRYGYDVVIHDGFSYYDDHPEYPYEFLRMFYRKKEEVGKQDPRYMFYKIIINGFYGKTIQLEARKHATEEEGEATDVTVKDGKKHFITESWSAGLLFNPVLAQEITGNTRSMLLDAVVRKQESVVAFATDSIIGYECPDITVGKRLGEWDEEESNSTFISVGSGVYWFAGGKVRFRGFGRGYDPDDIFVAGTGSKVPLMVKRNLKLKQSFRQRSIGYERFNLIIDTTKQLDLNFDRKRTWDRELRGVDDLLTSQVGSRPHEVWE